LRSYNMEDSTPEPVTQTLPMGDSNKDLENVQPTDCGKPAESKEIFRLYFKPGDRTKS
jgi:hypothetical protein